MSPRVELDDLLTGSEAARKLGLSYQRFHQLRDEHTDFPAPLRTFGKSMVWNWRHVERWARTHGYMQ